MHTHTDKRRKKGDDVTLIDAFYRDCEHEKRNKIEETIICL